MEKEGNKWESSKERRMLETSEKIEREERLQKGKRKREQLLRELEVKSTQQRITDMLKQLPENRRTVVELELEQERKLSLQEAKMELWRTRRNRNEKIRKLEYLRTKKMGAENKEELDQKLIRIEEELTKFKLEQEQKEREQAAMGEKRRKAKILREQRK